jgi:hypothetical protein
LLGTSETIQTQIVGEKSPADFVHGWTEETYHWIVQYAVHAQNHNHKTEVDMCRPCIFHEPDL